MGGGAGADINRHSNRAGADGRVCSEGDYRG